MAVIAGLGRAQKKSFAWSYSKLKNYETCPKRHYEIDLAKNYAEEQNPDPNTPLNWGNRFHEHAALALTTNNPLPTQFIEYQHWIDRVHNGPGKLYVEQKYAITREFQPTTYFAKDVWYRGIGDVVRIDGPVGLVLDWKTGKVVVDSVQLMLMAQCIFAHYPEVKLVRSEFVWIKDDCTTPEVFTRKEVAENWVALLDRVKAMEDADEKQEYPPKPGGLCRSWCIVTGCPYHGKGGR